MVDSRLREEIYKMTLEHVVGTESKYGLKKKKKNKSPPPTNKQTNEQQEESLH